MTDRNPIIDELAAAKTDAERARWLTRVPPATILIEHLEIRAILAAADFSVGLKAIDAELAVLCATRDRHGFTSPESLMARNIARVDLAIIARGGQLEASPDE